MPSAAVRRAAVDGADRARVAPPVELGQRFLRELGRTPDRGAPALPARFRPLASAIAGPTRQVRLSADTASQRALRAVDKEAVTVGDTIHVARPPGVDARTTEVLAHELVHVAHPSPTPRFFDDDVRGPEERMAERVAQVIARSPVVPSARSRSSAVARTGGPSIDDAVVRRTPAQGASRTAHGAVSAAELADALEGRHTASGRAATRAPLRRTPAGGSPSGSDSGRSEAGPDSPDPHAVPTESDAPVFGSGTREEREWFERLVEQSIEQIVRRVEERVVIDLERRGGRFWRTL